MRSPVKIRDMNRLAEYQKELRKKPRLQYLFFELTDRCNLQCRHCGSSCSYSNSLSLSMDVIEKALVSAAGAYDAKDIMVCLTGGEPMLYPHVYDVIRLSRQLGFFVGMTTNGTLIDDASAERLVKAGLDTIAISLDGLSDAHDALRAVNGSFDRAVEGIRSLKRAGLEPQVVTVIHKGNMDQLEPMYDLLRDMDIYSWKVVNVDPVGRAADDPGMLLEADDIRSLFEFIRSKRYDPGNSMEVTYACSHFVTYDYEREIRDFYFQCGAGTLVASIAANGDIIGCLDIERREDLVQGNIYSDDLADVWENRFKIFRKDRASGSHECGECEYRKVCMGDSAHTWDFENNRPRYCVTKMLEV